MESVVETLFRISDWIKILVGTMVNIAWTDAEVGSDPIHRVDRCPPVQVLVDHRRCPTKSSLWLLS